MGSVETSTPCLSGRSDRTQEKLELLSNPSTPYGVTPPLTPGQRSPPIFSPGFLTPGTYSPRPPSNITPASTRPPSTLMSPSAPRSPRGAFRSPRFLTPTIGTPMRNAFVSMKLYLEEIGHVTKLNPQDAWLPITESRNGNAYYSAFHNLNAGIGFQALLLPVAFTFLGWSWGLLALVIAFCWQMYTLWLLIQLHEAIPGKRYSRYVELVQVAFGEKLGTYLGVFPVLSLSAGTATGLIIFGGAALRLFYTTLCLSCKGPGLTTVEWYLTFAVLCSIVAQLPNLNSVAGISFVGAVMAVAYTTMVWALSVSKPRPPGVSYDIVKPESSAATAFSIFNALGIVAFAFRGHNLALEIQGTMPSTLKHPAYVPMWRGAKVAYAIVAFCFFPVAIAGYWAYGNKMPSAGILIALFNYHIRDIPSGWLAATFLFVALNSLSTCQIYSMPTFDFFEQSYTSKTNKPCPKLVRVLFRVFFVFLNFLGAIAFPFLSSFAGLLGGLTSIPVTFCYPCLMWIFIKKPDKFSFSWYLNWTLGILAIVLMFLVSAGGIWSIVDTGVKFSFFKPM